MEVEQGEYGQETVGYISLSCMHCADAPCVIACPTGALVRDAESGRVTVRQSKCIGCKMCLQACPFGVPQYGKDDLMQKCDLCLARLRDGETEPACVAACPSRALRYGEPTQLSKTAQEKIAAKLMMATGGKHGDTL
jgi:Fe-S-cluster-containing dehydrogenase component